MNKTYLITAIVIILCISTLFILEQIAPSAYEKITGLTITKTYIVPAIPRNCTGVLYEGWNMISFYCIPGVLNVSDLKDENDESISLVYAFSYNPSDASDSWFSYNPALPNWTVQDLSQLDREKGYWIYMEDTDNFFIEGFWFGETLIQLEEGYNLIGYPTPTTQNITRTFLSLESNYTMVYTYIAENDSWQSYDNRTGLGSLTETEIPEAYWVNATSDVTWVVNW